MSKKSKASSSAKRLAQKRARKAAMQAQYQKYAEMGKNQKSKRNRSKNARKGITTVSHPYGKCGNPGCTKCFGINFNPFLEGKVPVGMPPRMYSKWKEQRSV